MKPIVYVDMDDTLCDFSGAFSKRLEENKETKYPQSKEGFFLNLEPLEGAIDGYNFLDSHFDVWILTCPSVLNPLCYTEKRLWVEKHLGLERAKKLIISPDKSLFKGHYLIDDTDFKGQKGFEGKFMHFGKDYKNWDEVIAYFNELLKPKEVNLDLYNKTVYTGYDFGRSISDELVLDQFDSIKIIVPDYVKSINASFLEGLLSDYFYNNGFENISIESNLEISSDLLEAFHRFARKNGIAFG
jgi:5'(3')-deoxyribonucleotidase